MPRKRTPPPIKALLYVKVTLSKIKFTLSKKIAQPFIKAQFLEKYESLMIDYYRQKLTYKHPPF